MICILSINENKDITGWVIAVDLDDAKRLLPLESDSLYATLDCLKSEPEPGRYQLDSEHLMLVS